MPCIALYMTLQLLLLAACRGAFPTARLRVVGEGLDLRAAPWRNPPDVAQSHVVKGAALALTDWHDIWSDAGALCAADAAVGAAERSRPRALLLEPAPCSVDTVLARATAAGFDLVLMANSMQALYSLDVDPSTATTDARAGGAVPDSLLDCVQGQAVIAHPATPLWSAENQRNACARSPLCAAQSGACGFVGAATPPGPGSGPAPAVLGARMCCV